MRVLTLGLTHMLVQLQLPPVRTLGPMRGPASTQALGALLLRARLVLPTLVPTPVLMLA